MVRHRGLARGQNQRAVPLSTGDRAGGGDVPAEHQLADQADASGEENPAQETDTNESSDTDGSNGAGQSPGSEQGPPEEDTRQVVGAIRAIYDDMPQNKIETAFRLEYRKLVQEGVEREDWAQMVLIRLAVIQEEDDEARLMDEARKESEEWHKQEQARENPLHMKADEDVWEQLGKSDLLRAVGEALGRIRGEEDEEARRGDEQPRKRIKTGEAAGASSASERLETHGQAECRSVPALPPVGSSFRESVVKLASLEIGCTQRWWPKYATPWFQQARSEFEALAQGGCEEAAMEKWVESKWAFVNEEALVKPTDPPGGIPQIFVDAYEASAAAGLVVGSQMDDVAVDDGGGDAGGREGPSCTLIDLTD